jgi:hypothetical protein
MELSPSNPSFLDMRNSILQADVVATGGANAATIWSVFANRGMGFFSGAFNGDDSQPVENFSPPPGPNAKTSDLRGIVTDVDSGQPVEGAVVAFGGHNSGFPGDFAGSSNAAGRYRIPNIFVGSYPKVFAFKPGWDMQAIGRVTISEGANTQNFAIRRDWAALGGGGEITDFTGPDFTAFGCGPSGGIDQSLGTGWGSTSDGAKFITIKLPQPVDLTEFAVDPNATCGDGASASTKDFKIETSTDGGTFVESAAGSFPSDRSANGHLNPIAVGAGTGDNVQFVRFTMLTPNLLPEQVCPGPFSGCDFMDMSEIEVYGTAS